MERFNNATLTLQFSEGADKREETITLSGSHIDLIVRGLKRVRSYEIAHDDGNVRSSANLSEINELLESLEPIADKYNGKKKGLNIDMKLTEEDKEYLKTIGYEESDFEQIERAISKTRIYRNTNAGIKNVKHSDAIASLGRKGWLSGLARSAFHYTAARNPEKYPAAVYYFDSSELFSEEETNNG